MEPTTILGAGGGNIVEEASLIFRVLSETKEENASSSDNDSDVGEELASTALPVQQSAEDYKSALLDVKLVREMDSLVLENTIKSSFKTQTPRPHQPRTCLRIIEDIVKYKSASEPLVPQGGKNYLIQQAVGSGKSLTIACLAYHLMLLTENDRFKYDTILIMNDRSHLDVQLGDVVMEFLTRNNIKTHVRTKSSKHLESLFVGNQCRVIITTMQKFAKLNLLNSEDHPLKGRSIAIITDEAHRSHGRSTTRRLHAFLTGGTRQSAAITYFSFTCTPTPKCLEMFGVQKGNLKTPFYTFSMQEALDENLILNVIQNYTTVAVLTKIVGEKQDTKFNEGKKATVRVVNVTADDTVVMREKSRYIVSHLLKILTVVDCEGFKGRAMMVVRSRKHIVRYKQLIEEEIQKLSDDKKFDVVVAFTPFLYEGKPTNEGEERINGQYAKYCSTTNPYGIVQALRQDVDFKIRLIIVAEKFQTGFDEPSLSVMYVDKPLKGQGAVQTLGRLSRIAPHKTKTYVVDFVNARRVIGEAFGMFWGTTTTKSCPNEAILELHLEKSAMRLLEIKAFQESDIQGSVDFIVADELKAKNMGTRSSIMEDMSVFLDLCDRLQQDSQGALTYKFITDVKLRYTDRKPSGDSLNSLIDKVHVELEYIGAVTHGEIRKRNGVAPFRSVKRWRQTIEDSMSAEEIIRTANESIQGHIIDMLEPDEENTDTIWIGAKDVELAPPDLSSDNLEFAKQMWLSSSVDQSPASSSESVKLNEQPTNIDSQPSSSGPSKRKHEPNVQDEDDLSLADIIAVHAKKAQRMSNEQPVPALGPPAAGDIKIEGSSALVSDGPTTPTSALSHLVLDPQAPPVSAQQPESVNVPSTQVNPSGLQPGDVVGSGTTAAPSRGPVMSMDEILAALRSSSSNVDKILAIQEIGLLPQSDPTKSTQHFAEHLVKILKSGIGFDVKVHIAKTLACICKNNVPNCKVVFDKGALTPLVVLLTTMDNECILEALASLASIAQTYDQAQKVLQNHPTLKTHILRLQCSKSAVICQAVHQLKAALTPVPKPMVVKFEPKIARARKQPST